MMKSNGKKMFPGKNDSNIFFVEKKKNSNINPNKYVNKSHNPNNDNNNKFVNKNIPNLNKKNINSNIKMQTKSNNSIKDNRNRNNSLETYNSNSNKLKNNNSKLVKDSQINKRKFLYTERSVDCLRKKRVLGSFSTRNYLLNKNDIWKKHKSMDNTKNSRDYRPLNTFSSFSRNEIDNDSFSKINRKMPSNNYYNKFINKSSLEDNKKLSNKQIIKNRKNNNNPPPKEQTFIIKKIKPDNNLIDIKDLRKNFLENGINIISLTGLSCSLDPIDNDSAKIILNSKDINSNKFKKIEKYIKNKGLKFNEVKKSYNIKYTSGIYPKKSGWNDVTYGGREKFEKSEISSRFQKEQSEGKFHKKNLLSKTNFYKDIKYKNNFEIKPKRYNSVEKK